jgi:predicted MFS family arabinose efflux permease
VAFVVALPHAAEPSPSRASLNGLDGINFFNAAMLAGFGPYVAVYLAEQKWTQENIGFVLTASGLAGLLALMPGGELLDTVRSKRALAALGAIMVAVTALAAIGCRTAAYRFWLGGAATTGGFMARPPTKRW